MANTYDVPMPIQAIPWYLLKYLDIITTWALLGNPILNMYLLETNPIASFIIYNLGYGGLLIYNFLGACAIVFLLERIGTKLGHRVKEICRWLTIAMFAVAPFINLYRGYQVYRWLMQC